MSELREKIAKTLDSPFRYVTENGDKLFGLAENAPTRDTMINEIIDAVVEALPDKTDNRRLFLMVGDGKLSEEQIKVFAEMRQDGHNKAIKDIRQILQAAKEQTK